MFEKWLKLAETELEAAKSLFVNINPRPLLLICGHAHQSAGEALKAFLVKSGIEPPRTFNLAPLLAECVKVDQGFTEISFLCESLNKYNGVLLDPFRFEVLDIDAEIAMKRAMEILMFVNKRAV